MKEGKRIVEYAPKITIQKAINGYICRHLEEFSDGSDRLSENLFVITNDEEIKEFQELCYQLADYFGIFQLEISVKKRKK